MDKEEEDEESDSESEEATTVMSNWTVSGKRMDEVLFYCDQCRHVLEMVPEIRASLIRLHLPEFDTKL